MEQLMKYAPAILLGILILYLVIYVGYIFISPKKHDAVANKITTWLQSEQDSGYRRTYIIFRISVSISLIGLFLFYICNKLN